MFAACDTEAALHDADRVTYKKVPRTAVRHVAAGGGCEARIWDAARARSLATCTELLQRLPHGPARLMSILKHAENYPA